MHVELSRCAAHAAARTGVGENRSGYFVGLSRPHRRERSFMFTVGQRQLEFLASATEGLIQHAGTNQWDLVSVEAFR